MPENTIIDRAELAERLMSTGHYPTKRAALRAVDDVTRVIGACLSLGDTVHVKRFGRLSVTETKARMGRNPTTGESIPIAAGRRVKFRASKALLAGGEL